MSTSTSTFTRIFLAAALGLSVALSTSEGAEVDVIGTYDCNCAFRTKSLFAKGDDQSLGMSDYFVFGEDHSLAMYAFIPGAGTWSYSASKDTWNGDMSEAAAVFFAGMTLGTVNMKKAGVEDASLFGAMLAGELVGKWKARVGGKNLKTKLAGLFVGSPI